jgi:hypothetical protein
MGAGSKPNNNGRVVIFGCLVVWIGGWIGTGIDVVIDASARSLSKINPIEAPLSFGVVDVLDVVIDKNTSGEGNILGDPGSP